MILNILQGSFRVNIDYHGFTVNEEKYRFDRVPVDFRKSCVRSGFQGSIPVLQLGFRRGYAFLHGFFVTIHFQEQLLNIASG